MLPATTRREPSKMTRFGGRIGAAMLAGGFSLGLGGCNGGGGSAAPTTVPTAVAATTTTSTVPPTTVFAPSAPQASKDAAASHLVASWQAGDRASALTAAAPDAVAALFAQPYPAGGLQARGCSNAVAGPSSCIYRILANGNLVDISVLSGPGGWFASAAVVRG
jgi:hypothetical protein